MHEIYRHHDSSTVGLLNGILNEAGIPTVLKNWTGSNIVEVPIPSLYPSIHVMNRDQVDEANQMIHEYLNAQPVQDSDWVCPSCGAQVDGFLGECWACGDVRDASEAELGE